MRPVFDVAVAGAGPAGAATARRLARRGCRVALLESSRFEAPRPGESLAPSIRPLLADLGVWPRFEALRPLASYGTRSRWGDVELRDHSHLTSPYRCGWHVDRRAFDRMLAEAAADAGAELRRSCTAVRCERVADAWRLGLREGEARTSDSLSARVVVDATGRTARMARGAGAGRVVFDRMVGIGATFCGVDVSCEGFVLIESVREGWWYSAPVSADRMVAMLMTDADIYRRERLAEPGTWRDALAGAPATAERAGGAVVWGPRVFAAFSHRLRRADADAPWIGVGDAALAVDPISGSGVIRALRTARSAADAALAILDGERRPAIEAYEAARDAEAAEYLRERAAYYAIEERWPDAPFWARRANGIRRRVRRPAADDTLSSSGSPGALSHA